MRSLTSTDSSTADMRSDVQRTFMKCPASKQVMMFSATMTDSNRAVAKKFMKHVREGWDWPACVARG